MHDNALASVPRTDAAAATSAPHLRGGWLVVARIAWVTATLCALAFYVATVPSYVAYLRVVTPISACNGCLQLSPAAVQALHQLGLSMDAYVWYVIAIKLLIVLGYSAVGALLFWRASTNRVALVASLTLICYAIDFYAPPGGFVPGWPLLPEEVLAFLGAFCAGLFCCIFPSGRFVPRWTPWLLLAWTAYNAYDIFSLSYPQAPLVRTPPDFAISTGLVIGLMAVQIYRYRRVSTLVQRQQTKWALLGTALGGGGYTATFLVFVVMEGLGVLSFSGVVPWVGFVAGSLLTLCIPLGLSIAVLRSQLFDVDVLIQRTLVYGSLSVILATLYFSIVLGAQAVTERLSGQSEPAIILVASTLLIAALVNTLRHRLQAIIDRRFYRSKYDAARTLAAFGETLRTEMDVRELSKQLLAVVQETMQPASVSLWLRNSEKTTIDQRTAGSG